MITAPLSRSTELGLQVYLACLVSFQNHVVAIVFSMLKIHPILKIRISDIFSAYCNHLFNCDLDPKTQLRDWQIITDYLLGYLACHQQKSSWRRHVPKATDPGLFFFITMH